MPSGKYRALSTQNAAKMPNWAGADQACHLISCLILRNLRSTLEFAQSPARVDVLSYPPSMFDVIGAVLSFLSATQHPGVCQVPAGVDVRVTG